MAQDKPNSSFLGELFVEIGATGLPTLLKDLNGVSAGFNLAKKTVEAFTKPFLDNIKKVGEYSIKLRDLRSEVGLTNKQTQQIENWAMANTLDEDTVLGDISTIIDQLTHFKKYNYFQNGQWYEAQRILNQAGGQKIDFTQYDNTVEGAFQLLNDVYAGIDNIKDIGLKRTIPSSLGVSSGLLSYGQFLEQLGQDANIIADDYIQLAEEVQQAKQRRDNAWTKLKQEWGARSSVLMTPLYNLNADLISKGEKGNNLRTKVSQTLLEAFLFKNPMQDVINLKNILNEYTPHQLSKPLLKEENLKFEKMPLLDKMGESELLESGRLPSQLPSSINTIVNQDISIEVNESSSPMTTARTLKRTLQDAQLNAVQLRNQWQR